MNTSIATVENFTDFYNILHRDFEAVYVPMEQSQSVTTDNDNINLSVCRYVFAPGFELSISKYHIKNDFFLECEPQYSSIELQAIYEIDNYIASKPDIFMRVFGDDDSTRHCAIHYQKGRYFAVEMAVTLQHLPRYIDVQALMGLRCAEYELNSELLFSDVIGQIRNNFQIGNMQKLYYQAKSLELLSFIVSVLEKNSINADKVCSRLCAEDIAAIKKAHEIIHDRYDTNLAIKQLASMVYINSDKLKTGYKALYGMSVHEAVISRKMEVAYRLVTHEHTSVKDTSLQVGYSNQGHFIDLFRRYYGFTPGELLLNAR
ncbi:helix-turn-helix transcriptional regulator [Faecalispora jeddahensis]|uniref:helix-turn-helix transcriptional regulator n=1 Tax=Faecalispora jeddahensis TaxID=1414721 RepID=UPI001897B884|nr:AraC family transcriptional regulator [Faecalispora jeddahensis]